MPAGWDVLTHKPKMAISANFQAESSVNWTLDLASPTEITPLLWLLHLDLESKDGKFSCLKYRLSSIGIKFQHIQWLNVADKKSCTLR